MKKFILMLQKKQVLHITYSIGLSLAHLEADKYAFIYEVKPTHTFQSVRNDNCKQYNI